MNQGQSLRGQKILRSQCPSLRSQGKAFLNHFPLLRASIINHQVKLIKLT